jgi:glyoxylase-like metal-dependent hydrolase (beta-lactamase superfamily II)
MRIFRVLCPNPGLRELDGTNTWILGERPSIVVDPGPSIESHLREVAASAGDLAAILLTHDHPDHAPGATELAEMTGATVHAVRPPDGGERLHDGQAITVGSVEVRVVATPGHTPDSVSFFVPAASALLTGDTVVGRGTSVIDPPEGDLTAYLRSLERLRDLSPRAIHPGHGPLVLDGVAKLDEYLEHRRMREEQVLAALADGGRTIQDMVPVIYEGYPTELHELAGRSILAHLLKLEAEGRAKKRTRDGQQRWSLDEPRTCARCGRQVRGRGKLCGPCSLAVLQESAPDQD